MKKLSVYDVYLECGQDVYKVTVPAENAKDAERYCEGNGDVIATKKASLQDIDLDFLEKVLRSARYGQAEIDVILRTLIRCGLDRQ